VNASPARVNVMRSLIMTARLQERPVIARQAASLLVPKTIEQA
jgi:hypothetical protein